MKVCQSTKLFSETNCSEFRNSSTERKNQYKHHSLNRKFKQASTLEKKVLYLFNVIYPVLPFLKNKYPTFSNWSVNPFQVFPPATSNAVFSYQTAPVSTPSQSFINKTSNSNIHPGGNQVVSVQNGPAAPNKVRISQQSSMKIRFILLFLYNMWLFTYGSSLKEECFVEFNNAYICTYVWAREKETYFIPLAMLIHRLM